MKNGEFSPAMERYLASLPSSGKSENTIRTYRIALRKFGDYLADKPESQNITPDTVTDFRTAMFENGATVNTIRHTMIILHGFYRSPAAGRLNGKKNPVIYDDIPDEEPREYNLLSKGMILSLLAEKGDKSKKNSCRNTALVVLLLQSGLRNSELRSLTPEDLDFQNGRIIVRHGKGNKRRIAPFPELSQRRVLEYLQTESRPKYCTDQDTLFGSTADENGRVGHGRWHPMSSDELNAIVKRFVYRATGKDGIHAHTLRHAAASYWDDLGVPIRDVQNALGHSSVRTTEKIYISILDKEKSSSKILSAFDGGEDE